jgi:hypothetical protein
MVKITRMLREDHKKVKELFDHFEKAEGSEEQKRIADEALMELQVHVAIENEIVYPTLEEDDEELLNEALEEHHVVDLLIDELKGMKSADAHFSAKFTVLAENVRHHIKEEESKILPKLEAGDADLDEMADRARRLKERLVADPSLLDEHKTEDMSAAASPRGGSAGKSHARESRPRNSATTGSRSGASSSGSPTKGSHSKGPAANGGRKAQGTMGGATTRVSTRQSAKAEK